MPYYPDDQSTENLDKIRWSHVCAECGRPLYIYYDLGSKLKYVACSSLAHLNAGIAKSYQLLNEDYQSKIRREYELEKQIGTEKTTALAKYQSVPQMTRQIATEIVNTLWGDAPAIEKTKAIILCHTYNLNPLMKHIHLVPYKRWDRDHKEVLGVDWSMMMGIQAKRLLAHRKHFFSYMDLSPRFMTEEEQIKIYGKKQDGCIMSITILRDVNTGATAQGYGRIKVGEKVKGEDKGNSPEHMSQIRSESQAIERLYPGEMPEGVEVVDSDYEVIDDTEIPDISAVDTKTGEIFDGDFRETTEEKPVDITWLIESVNSLNWNILAHIKQEYHVDTGGTLTDVVNRLDTEQRQALCKEVQDRLDMR